MSCATLEANSSAETANLKETAPDTKATAETWVIIGADLIYTVPKWIRGDFLVANVPFFVLPRKGFVVDPVVVEARHVYYALPKYFSETSHSSTQARRLLGMPVNPNSQVRELTFIQKSQHLSRDTALVSTLCACTPCFVVKVCTRCRLNWSNYFARALSITLGKIAYISLMLDNTCGSL